MQLLPSRIAMRIPMGFGLMLVIALVIGAVGYINIVRLADGFTRYETVRASTALVNNASVLFSDLRGQAKVYVASGRRADADRFNELAGELRNELAVIVQKVDSDAARDVVSSLLTELDNYEGNFAMITSAVSMRDNARSQMDSQGGQMANTLNAAVTRLINDATYQDAALLGRLLEKLMHGQLEATRMRSAYSPETKAAAEQAFAELQKTITETGRQVSDIIAYAAMSTLSKAMEDYASAFERSLLQTARVEEAGNAGSAEIADTIADQMQRLVTIQRGAMSQERDSAFETVRLSELVIAASSAIALLLGIALSILTIRTLVPPLRALTQALRRLAERDWTTEVPGLARRDELGDIARTVAVFKDNGLEAERMTEAQSREAQAKQARQEKMEQAIAQFEAAVGNALGALSGSAAVLNQTAQGMSELAETTSGRATAVAAAAEEASVNVQTVAASSEELYASVEEIGRQVASSTEIAERASLQAETAGGKVQSLADAAERIGAVVQLISDIAGQTNLLALNATIESARAGEAGKGFAVVASEVKNLAGQTGKATEEIAQQIGAIQAETRETVAAIAEIRKTIVSVSEITTAIASAVHQQSAATAEISRNVQQASSGTQEVTTNIVTVSEAAVQTGTGARSVLDSSTTLSEQSSVLRREVDRFLETIRAA